MSKVNESVTTIVPNVPNELLAEFLPEELTLNPKFDIRGDSTDADERAMAELMDSIRLDGQQQPAKVRRVDTGMEVVFGHRRYEAVQRINLAAEAGVEPLKLKCIIIDATDDQALKMAWVENAKRKNMNPLEEARFIGTLREQYAWKGNKGTRKVAEFMGKSPAWVSEREKLVALDKETQELVVSGQLSAEAALMMPNVKPEERAGIVADARESHQAEQAAKGKSNKRGKNPPAGSNAVGDSVGAVAEAVVETGKPKPIPASHVAKAVRNKPHVKVDPNKTKSLKAKPIVGFFESYIDGIPYLYPVVQDFLIYFVESYVKGKGSDRTMSAKFEAAIAPACKGPKCEPRKADEPPMPKSASKVKKAPKTPKTPKPGKTAPVKPAKKKSKSS